MQLPSRHLLVQIHNGNTKAMHEIVKIAKILIYNIIFNMLHNDVAHRKIFTISKILAIFVFLNIANLLLIDA